MVMESSNETHKKIIEEKEKIKRDQLSYSMLRRVIIRADFTSMLDTDKIVSLLNEDVVEEKKWFGDVFNNYAKLQLIVDDKRVKDATAEEPAKLYVRRFNDCNVTADRPERNVTFDITDQSVCVDIICDDKYTKIDAYLQLVVDTLDFIIQHDKYVKLTRIAIRKYDAQAFANGEDADNVFEYFDQGITDSVSDAYWQRTYTDNFIYGKTKVKTNYTRTLKITDKENERFVFVLDIDTFLDSDMIENPRPPKDDLKRILFERINEASFELFKRGVKLEFLKSKLK